MPRSPQLTHRLLAGLLVPLLASTVSCTPPGPISPGNLPNKGGKTLMAIYMIGSDLEDDFLPPRGTPDEQVSGTISKVGHGTSDLWEIIKGYQELTPEQRANVDVFVAFGGARKQGWQGVKYADLDTLVKDSEDGYFGNLDEGYAYQNRQANMGDEATLRHFLTTVRERGQTAGVTMTSFWNHGGSYSGFGPDSNHLESGTLSLAEITSAFQTSRLRADLIGFDACLMASAEVIRAIQPFGTYLVASEELEPGHGWDYTPIVTFLGRNPGPQPLSFGRTIVDSFITSPLHQETSGKTLSVIDLQRATAVLQGIDRLAQSLRTDMDAAYQPLITATLKSGRFGRMRTADQRSHEASVDLSEFAQQLKARLPHLSGAADALYDAVRQAVVYNRTDGTAPHANGVGILSFNNAPADLQWMYKADNAATAGWYDLLTRFLTVGTADQVPPVILEEEWIEQNGRKGRVLTIRDDKALREVAAIHAVADATARHVQFVAYETLDSAPEGKALFVLPAWDGLALHVANGPLSATNGQLLTVEAEPGPNGLLQYTSMAKLNGRDVAVTLQWDKTSQQVGKVWASAYTLGANGQVSFDRQQYTIGQGDEISFYQPVLDTETGDVSTQLGPTIRFTQAPSWGKRQVQGKASYFAYAEDAKENVAVSSIYPVE